MTGPFNDWPPHMQGLAPTWEQIEDVRDLYRREAERSTLADMRAELRHLYDRTWSLKILGQRVHPAFADEIEADEGAELEAARARLDLAGRPTPQQWTRVEGGWDGPVG